MPNKNRALRPEPYMQHMHKNYHAIPPKRDREPSAEPLVWHRPKSKPTNTAAQCNNPGKIAQYAPSSPWLGAQPPNNPTEPLKFHSYLLGLRALCRTLRTRYNHALKTPAELFTSWTPPIEQAHQLYKLHCHELDLKEPCNNSPHQELPPLIPIGETHGFDVTASEYDGYELIAHQEQNLAFFNTFSDYETKLPWIATIQTICDANTDTFPDIQTIAIAMAMETHPEPHWWEDIRAQTEGSNDHV